MKIDANSKFKKWLEADCVEKTERECQCDICQSYPVMSPEWQQKSIERANEQECPECGGLCITANPLNRWDTCPICHGSGKIKEDER